MDVQFERAVEDYSRAVEFDYADFISWHNPGAAYREAESTQKAAENFQSEMKLLRPTLETNPENRYYSLHYSDLLFDPGHVEESFLFLNPL